MPGGQMTRWSWWCAGTVGILLTPGRQATPQTACGGGPHEPRWESVMDKDTEHFVGQYRQALHNYMLSDGDEAALLQAYDMGRQVLARGQNVMELMLVHQAVLLSSILGPLLEAEAARVTARSEAFLQQALVPFEIARRRVDETVTDLHLSNEALEQRVAERTAEIQKLNADLEQRIAERTRQLEAANQELQAFAYSVSHDLRAPLRHMVGYTELLQKGASSALDQKNRRYMTMILESAKRMGELIDDLLAFSRIGRAEARKTLVSLEQLVKALKNALSPQTQGS